MDEQNGILDFSRPGQQRLVQEALAADDVPAVCGIAAALVIAARGLIVGVIVLDEPGGILGQGVDDAAGALVSTCRIVLGPLLGQSLALLLALSGRVLAGEITFHVDLAHIVHGTGYGCLDSRIKRCSVDRHSTKTADADDADALRVDQVTGGKEIHCGQEILRIDVRRRHPARLSAGLARKGRVEGDGQEPALGHMLGIQAAGLLLYGAERAAHGKGGKPAFCVLGDIHIGRQLNAIAVVEGDLAVVDKFRFGKCLVPFLGKIQGTHILVSV